MKGEDGRVLSHFTGAMRGMLEMHAYGPRRTHTPTGGH
jgi:hypothetical protein